MDFCVEQLKKSDLKRLWKSGLQKAGTTGIIMNALKMSGCFAEFYSVDLCEKFYRDSNLSTGYCNIVAWCDKNYKKFDVDMQIQSPELIQNLKYDYILVAVENRDVFEEIKAELCNIYYCDESKIIGPIDHQARILNQ